MTSLHSSEKGMSLLGAIVAVMILAAMGSSMAVLVATNQATLVHQYYADQSFASAQAGMEVALGLIRRGVGPCDSLSRNLSGDVLTSSSIAVNRANSRIYVTGSKGDSTTAVSIRDPNPPSGASVLQFDTSSARDYGNGGWYNTLSNISFQLPRGCSEPVTITAMRVSWFPDAGETVLTIRIDWTHTMYDIDWNSLPNVFNATGAGMRSGQLIDTSDMVVGAGPHVLNDIRWDAIMMHHLYTIDFYLSSGDVVHALFDSR